MTLDEFKRNVAPYMRHGWIAMDEDEEWFWYEDKPREVGDKWLGDGYILLTGLLEFFEVKPLTDWTQSCFEVGIVDHRHDNLDLKLSKAKWALEFYGDSRNYSINMEGDFEEHFAIGEYQKVGTLAKKTLEDIE